MRRQVAKSYFFSATGDRLDGERRLRLLSFFEGERDRVRERRCRRDDRFSSCDDEPDLRESRCMNGVNVTGCLTAIDLASVVSHVDQVDAHHHDHVWNQVI